MNRNKIKIIIAICLVSVLYCQIFSEVTNATNSYVGTVNLNLNNDGSNMMSDLQEAKISINDTKIEENDLSIHATVTYDNNNYPLYLKTQLRKSLTLDEVLVGSNPYDKSNNFNVVFVSTIKNSKNKNCFVTKHNSENNSDILQIYLLKNDTREFFMFELPLHVLNNYNSKTNYNVPMIENIEDEHWWIKTLKPVKNERVLTKMSPVEDDEYFDTILYNGPEDCYKYTIKLKASSTVYSYEGSDTQEDDSYLRMVEQKYYCNGKEYDKTFLGVYNCVAQSALVSKTYTYNAAVDTIRRFEWGYDVHTDEGGLSISPGLWIGKVVGAGITWTPYTSIFKSSGHKTFDDDDELRGCKITMKNALTKVDDQYSLTIRKYNEGFQSGKLTRFIYSFDIGFHNDYILKSGNLTVVGSYE